MRVRFFILIKLFILLAFSAPAFGESFKNDAWHLESASSTHLVGLDQASELSKLVAGFRGGGFESATGQWVGFDRWYRSSWMDTRITWMTQVTPDFGVLWGFGSGEVGEKYRISSSLRLGFVYQAKLASHSYFSVRATSFIGGGLREKACTADYGDIGGVTPVNCRMAATQITPADTLNYVVNAPPPDRHSILFKYNFDF